MYLDKATIPIALVPSLHLSSCLGSVPVTCYNRLEQRMLGRWLGTVEAYAII